MRTLKLKPLLSSGLLWLGLLWLALMPQPARSVEIWTEDDWSNFAFGAIDSLDAESEPGSLILSNDPDRMVFAFDASPDYFGVWTMVAWRDHLYVGVGDYPMSDDGGDIVAYDYATDSSWVDYQVFEQGIAVLKTNDGKIYSPGIDSMGSHLWGNIYLNDGGGWLRKETVPDGIHVDDIAFHDDKLWVSMGSGAVPLPGELLSSSDEGETWTSEFQVEPLHPDSFRRLYGMTTYDGSLFVMSDFKQPEGKVIFEFGDLGMTTHTISASGSECLAGFVEFQGKLLCLTRTILDIYDGNNWDYWILPYATTGFVCNAIGLYRNRVYLGGVETIIASSDLEIWTEVAVTSAAGREIKCFAEYRGRLYAGSLSDAEVYVTAAANSGTLTSLPHRFSAPLSSGQVEWSAILPGPATGVALQLRSAATEADLPTAPFLGPGGEPGGWFETSGTPIAAAHSGHRWFQYRVRLTSTLARLAPILDSVSLIAESDPTGLATDTSAGDAALGVWPNPFSGSVHLSLPPNRTQGSSVLIFDLRGRLLRELPSRAGEMVWDGRDAGGRSLPAGIYLLRYPLPDGSTRTQRVLRLR